MGANAQTTVQKFVDGAVLTAAQQNTSAATGVPVFATTVTRDAAFGGANKVLAEGQTCYLESTNVVQYYDGAAWATVGPAAAPTSGLVVVKAEQSFSAASDFFADNVFTSAYTNYLLSCNYTTVSVGGLGYPQLVLRVGGVDATTSYNNQRLQSSGATVSGARSTGGVAFDFGQRTSGDFKSSFQIDIAGPQVAQPTSFMSRNSCADGAYTFPLSFYVTGNHSLSVAYDGFKVYPYTGTITGTYTVYGYGKTL